MGDPLAVVVDTTAIYPKPLLDGVEWIKLLSRSRRGEVELKLSEVSVREADRQFRARCKTAARKAAAAHRSLREFGIALDEVADPRDLARAAADDYDERIRTTLADAGASILPIPGMTVESLLERDLDGRKPFNSDGKGFRDALIWESIRELAATQGGGSIIFVTNNRKDFCEGSELHSDLSADLHSDTAVSICRSLHELHERLDAMFAEADRMHEEAKERQSGFAQLMAALETPIQLAVDGAVMNLLQSPVREPSDEELGSFGLDLGDLAPRELTNLVVTAAYPLDGTFCIEHVEFEHLGDVDVYCSIDVEVTVEGLVAKADYEHMHGEQVDVISWDFNEHFLYVRYTDVTRVTFRLMIVDSRVVETEFDSARKAPPSDVADSTRSSG